MLLPRSLTVHLGAGRESLPLSPVSAFPSSSIQSKASGIYSLLHLFHNSADASKSANSTILTAYLLFPAVSSRDAQRPCGPTQKIAVVEKESLKIICVP